MTPYMSGILRECWSVRLCGGMFPGALEQFWWSGLKFMKYESATWDFKSLKCSNRPITCPQIFKGCLLPVWSEIRNGLIKTQQTCINQ